MSPTPEPEPHSHHDRGSTKPDARVDRQPCQLVRVIVVGFGPFRDDFWCLIEDVGRQDHDGVEVRRERRRFLQVLLESRQYIHVCKVGRGTEWLVVSAKEQLESRGDLLGLFVDHPLVELLEW